MSSSFFIIVISCAVFCFGCGKVPPELMIDSFEGILDLKTVDFGSSEDSSLKVEAEKNLRVDGAQSMKLVYNLNQKGYMWAARGYNLDVEGAARWLVKPKRIRWKAYDALSLYMYGTNSGKMVAFDIKDAGGEMWRVLLHDDFKDWKEMIFPFEKFFARTDWQPEIADKNEVLDFPIISFQFEPRSPGTGICYFDCVKVVQLEQEQ